MPKGENFKSIETEEIYLIDIINFIVKNIKFISKYTGIIFFISIIIAYIIPKTWEGEFQIVVSKKQPRGQITNLLRGASSIENLFGKLGSNNTLKTEVEILKSPSVLMPIFEYVKESRGKKGRDMIYKEWLKSNMKIKLGRGTSVVKLVYRDKNKDIILPVLKKSSKEYQKYSGAARIKSIENGLKYMDKQVNLYRKKTKESQSEFINFVINNDLSLVNKDLSNNFTFQNLKNIPNDKQIINPEVNRANTAGEIRYLKEQISKLEKKDIEQELFIPTLQNIVQLNQLVEFELLQAIEKEIDLLKINYRDSDPLLKQKMKEKNSIEKRLRNKSIKFLKGRIIALESQKKSLERPSEVIIEYQLLYSELQKNKNTLANLEKEQRILSLQEAKSEDPWELITKPTISEKPVSPNKKVVALLGLIMGFILSTFYSYYKNSKFKK